MGRKRNEEQKWVMTPTNNAAAIPSSLILVAGSASGYWRRYYRELNPD